MSEPRKLTHDDFVRMNLPRDFWPATSDKISDSARPSVRQYGSKIKDMLKEGLGFVLIGGPGVGKTGIAAVLAKTAKCYGCSVFFVTVSDLREMIRAHIDYDDRSILERCKAVDLLILDNLKAEDEKDLSNILNASSLSALVEHRVGWKRSTLITTRLDPTEFPRHFPGLFETLKARSPFLPVTGENLRDLEAKAIKERLVLKKEAK
jgi:DNA replication protein DnaC